MLAEQTMAPDFELEADDGERVKLSDMRGRKVVLYFYPKDNTSGCIAEACSFRDDYGAFVAKGALVLGVSPDTIKSHVKFKTAFALPFRLLSDPDHAVAAAYGAWGPKKMYGKEYEGILRTTFVIDEEGRIIKVFPNVKPQEHAREVAAYL